MFLSPKLPVMQWMLNAPKEQAWQSLLALLLSASPRPEAAESASPDVLPLLPPPPLFCAGDVPAADAAELSSAASFDTCRAAAAAGVDEEEGETEMEEEEENAVVDDLELCPEVSVDDTSS